MSSSFIWPLLQKYITVCLWRDVLWLFGQVNRGADGYYNYCFFFLSLPLQLVSTFLVFFIPLLSSLFLHINLFITIILPCFFHFYLIPRQGPCGICRPMNPWRWWSSTTVCRPSPTRLLFRIRAGSTSPTRIPSPAMPSGPPSSRTPLAASGRRSPTVIYSWIKVIFIKLNWID